MDLTATVIVGALAMATPVLGWRYFDRWQIAHPPIGVFDLTDVLVTLGGILVIPLLYLALPTWAVCTFLALGALGAVFIVAEPILRSTRWCWLAIVAAVAGEAWAFVAAGPGSAEASAINNAIVILGAVGVGNLWAQSGLRARDTAILAGALTAYDVWATSYLPLMSDLFARLGALPFAPLVSWPGQDGGRVSVGLGDLVVLTVFPLVMRKGYGRAAGRFALLSGCSLLAGIFVVGVLHKVAIFPVMAVLGPTILLQYGAWRLRAGVERTLAQYRRSQASNAGATRPAGPAALVQIRPLRTA